MLTDTSPLPGLDVLDSGVPGPRLLLVAQIHGDEPAGLDALRAARVRFASDGRGTLSLLRANLEAARRGIRFVTHDLNRVFGAPKPPDGPEGARAREIRAFFERAGTPDVVVDFHSTPTASPPMGITSLSAASRDLMRRFPVRRVLAGLPEKIPGHPMLAWFETRGAAGAAFECGRHGDPTARDRAARLGDLAVRLAAGENPAPTRGQSWIRATESVETSDPSFRFARDFRGFERLAPGETWAWERGRPLAFPEARTIAIPNPDVAAHLAAGAPRAWAAHFGVPESGR